MASHNRMWYVYVLRSENDPTRTYIGITEDLDRRIAEHNSDTQYFTSRYSPWRLDAYIAFSDKKKAFSFEKYLKVGSGKAFLNKRIIGSGS